MNNYAFGLNVVNLPLPTITNKPNPPVRNEKSPPTCRIGREYKMITTVPVMIVLSTLTLVSGSSVKLHFPIG